MKTLLMFATLGSITFFCLGCTNNSQSVGLNGVGIITENNSDQLINLKNYKSMGFPHEHILQAHFINQSTIGLLMQNGTTFKLLTQNTFSSVRTYNLSFNAVSFCPYKVDDIMFLSIDRLEKLNLTTGNIQSYPLGYVAQDISCFSSISTIVLINIKKAILYLFSTVSNLTYLVKQLPFSFVSYFIPPNFQAVYFVAPDLKQIFIMSLLNFTYPQPIKLPSKLISYAINNYYYFAYLLASSGHKIFVLNLLTGNLLGTIYTDNPYTTIISAPSNIVIAYYKGSSSLQIYKIDGISELNWLGSLNVEIPFWNFQLIT